ncbi:family 10 glycoside hydrolase [Melampsora larici-populina 98AG31]|uniref:Beta-xylanase n=1 Tax=Melampsora larici-populina (strain 98AG31 / pathotype 3-4-7) TaxID=747676 RepID=F4RD01_MELLP|nr:family 10 glycoside hydrolase [Melampsora larici-populina 98AG31]EGG09898.1 family 10 glycoside hydrolase [Melampsora larici-populina 98AG31]
MNQITQPINGNDASNNGTGGGDTPDPDECQEKIYVGTAVDTPYFNNQSYVDAVKTYFEYITPGNVMKWDATEKTQGVFSFNASDKIVKFAKDNGKTIRGHVGVWHNQVPQWLKDLDGPGLVNATQNHIKTVLQYYKDDLYSFDVCNEVLGDDGNLRDSFWSQKLNDSFIEMAFQAALDAGTNIKLYINDYNVEGLGKKSDAYYAIVKSLAEKKLLHGVGLQGHMIVGKLPRLEEMKANLKRYVDLGLEVAYTEVDVRLPLPASPKDLAQQAQDYATFVTACKETPGCKGVTVWGVGYPDSWVPSTFHNFGDALLLDDNYQPTEAFNCFEQALKGNVTQGSS